ncbi:MAG: hypothetical protein DM484_08290, partial [Candidatus Methylumidiphilus alinenensis]
SLGTSGNAVIPAGIAGIQIPGMAKFAEIATPTANDRFRKLTPSFLLFLLTLLFLTTPMLAHATTAVGATPGSFKVNETGAATYTIPITVPPGTAGMAPTLSLNYNSQSGNGPLGVGWSLGGLSAITRCPASFAQDGFKGGINYDGNDRFCLDGQRLVLVAGSYGADGAQYRTETESYTRVISYGTAGNGPAWFKAWTKSGQIIEYGNTADSRIEAQGKPTVRVWGVNKISDTKSNYIAVSYTEDNANGEFNLSRIDYTGNAAAGVAPYASVQFGYEVRPDVESGYEVGSIVKNSKRIVTIKTYSTNILIKYYQLSYEQSSAIQRSRFKALVECDGGSTPNCVQPTTFKWQDDTGASSWATWNPPSTNWPTVGSLPGNRMYTGDVNGDGKTDIIFQDGYHTGVWYLPGGQSAWVVWSPQSLNWPTLGDLAGNYLAGNRTYTGDVNGDGKTDLIYQDGYHTGVWYLPGGQSTWVVWSPQSTNWPTLGDLAGLRTYTGDVNGDGKTDLIYQDGYHTGVWYLAGGQSTWAVWSPQSINWPTLGDLAGNYLAGNRTYTGDVNGDGKTDLIYQDGYHTGVWYLPGGQSTWVVWSPQSTNWPTLGDLAGLRTYTGDVNGDGKTDLIYQDGYHTGVWYLAGGQSTWAVWSPQSINWPTLGDLAGNYLAGNRTYTGDVNGDGKTDLIFQDGYHTGVWYLPGGQSTWVVWNPQSVNWPTIGADSGYRMFTGDTNGDGKTDLIFQDGYHTGIWTYAYGPVFSNSLSSITTGSGLAITFSYKLLTDNTVYTKDTNAVYPYLDFQGPLYVVSQTQTSNGIGGNYTTNYTYAGAKLHEQGGGFLGFRQIAVNDPQTGITTTTSYSQNYPYQGLPQTVVKQAANGQILNSAQNTWQMTSLGGGAYHRSGLIQTNEQSWDLNGAAMPRTQTNTSYDGYGNATQIIVKTDDGYASTGPVSPFGNVKTTTNTYSNDTTNWLLGRLTRATVTSTLPTGTTATRTSAFAYDPASGLLTQEIIEPDNPSLKLTTNYTLDAFGNRVAVTVSGADITTRTSSTQYDAQGRFAVSSTNALGHKGTRTFEPGFGNPVSLTGPNGLTTTWAYDGFGRKLQENRVDGTQSNFTFNFCANNCPANGVYYTTATTSGAPASTVFFDSLNREIRKSTVGFDGRVASVDKLYNSLGQVASTSRPYFPTDTVSWTQFQYDTLGRTVKITEADGGVTQTAYNGLNISVTNPLNHTTQQLKNGLGQVVQTINAHNKLMQFAFDPFGNPVKTLDPNGNTITLAYDIRGRKTAMTDPDMGAWSYGYDVLGEMTRQTDAKGQTTTVSYDVLGRVVKRQEPGLNSAWTWDTATKGIGKLAAETSDNGFARSYAYDNVGRLAQTTTSISGAGSYYQSTLYDAYGRVSTFTQPTGLSVVNVYNSYGYLSQVLDGSTQKPYWQAQQVDASGRIILERLGNNLYTQRSFDAMGRPTYISTGKFGVTPDIQNLTLNHDQNGNLISRDDYATQRGDSFAYDELDRLTTDLGPGGKILNYQYDELGNINFKTDVGSYFYGTKPHAVTQISGNINTTLQYDANGNQTNGINNRTVAYTAFNLPSKIVQGINTVTFDYDSNHERFRQTASNGTTIYLNPRMDLGGHFEQTTSGSVVENRHTVYAAGKAIAEVVTRGSVKQTRYFHTDHLGSIDAVTDDNAFVLARYAFDPFGNRTALYGSLNTINHGFTGHEQLPDVGLIHMNGRVYDPTLGRFLSADPQIQAPENLQDYNRYSYVLNNPLVFTDPSGYSWFSNFMKSTVGKIITIAAVITISVLTYGATAPYFASLTGSAFAGGILGGAVSGLASGFVGGFMGSGGNLDVAFKGALYGGIAGGIAGGITVGANSILSQTNATVKAFKDALAAGLGGGLGARVYGGNFGRGFEYAFLASMGRTALDAYVENYAKQHGLGKYQDYKSTGEPAKYDAVYKDPNIAITDEPMASNVGEAVTIGKVGTPLPQKWLSVGEDSILFNWIAKNVAVINDMSKVHDPSMQFVENNLGDNLSTQLISKLSIPVYTYAQFQANDLANTQYRLRLLRNER